jgi:hypothetical protein
MHSDKWRKTFRALFGRAEFQRSSKDTTMWSEMFLTVLHLGVKQLQLPQFEWRRSQ